MTVGDPGLPRGRRARESHSCSSLCARATVRPANSAERADERGNVWSISSDAEAREMLRQYAKQKTVDMFPDNPANVRLGNPSTYELLQRLEDMLLALKPQNLRAQWWMGQAMTLASKIGDIRWLIAQQVGQGTPKRLSLCWSSGLPCCSLVSGFSRHIT